MTKWKEITDPEELFRLKREGWEIQLWHHPSVAWFGWPGLKWDILSKFRARPPQPKMKKMKMLCYLAVQQLVWRFDDYKCPDSWIRIPAEDKEIEVPDDN